VAAEDSPEIARVRAALDATIRASGDAIQKQTRNIDPAIVRARGALGRATQRGNELAIAHARLELKKLVADMRQAEVDAMYEEVNELQSLVASLKGGETDRG